MDYLLLKLYEKLCNSFILIEFWYAYVMTVFFYLQVG